MMRFGQSVPSGPCMVKRASPPTRKSNDLKVLVKPFGFVGGLDDGLQQADLPVPPVEAAQAFLRHADTVARYKQLFLEMPQQTDPAAFSAFMARELTTFRDLARAQNIVVE